VNRHADRWDEAVVTDGSAGRPTEIVRSRTERRYPRRQSPRRASWCGPGVDKLLQLPAEAAKAQVGRPAGPKPRCSENCRHSLRWFESITRHQQETAPELRKRDSEADGFSASSRRFPRPSGQRETVSIGSLNASIVHPREVFLPAILHSAASVVLVHNHPSGDPEPSEEDLSITRRLVQVGELVGIAVLDHVIVAARGSVSLRARQLLGRRRALPAPGSALPPDGAVA